VRSRRGPRVDPEILGATTISPPQAIEANPDVAEVAVVGAEDREWGERVRAFVVCKPGTPSTKAPSSFGARERLGAPKVPRDFVFARCLAAQPTGKVLKHELRSYSVSASAAVPTSGQAAGLRKG
jgi:fatty-acyl-CoA synthase